MSTVVAKQRLRLLLAAACVSILVGGAAMTKPQVVGTIAGAQAGTASIAGRIVDAGTGAPVGGVTVRLQLVPERPIQFPTRDLGYIVVSSYDTCGLPSTETKADGRFEFSRLQPGAYVVECWKPGREWSSWPQANQWITLHAGEIAQPLSIPMNREPFIEGRVSDPDGKPVIGVEVVAYPAAALEGLADGLRSHATRTDDRGVYHLGLPSGQYLVRAIVPGLTRSDAIRAPDQTGVPMMYQSMFYPGVTAAKNAGRIPVAAGEDRTGLDIQLQATRAFRVQGTVEPAIDFSQTFVQLVKADASAIEADASVASASIDTGGRFTAIGVPPGTYVVRFRKLPRLPYMSHGVAPLQSLPAEPSWWADLPVTVTDRDASVVVPIRQGARVSGRVAFEGSAPPPSDLSKRVIVAYRADGASIDVRGLFLPDGRFTTIQAPPGLYVMGATSPEGWRIRSIDVDGRDAMDYPFELGITDIADAVITFTDRLSTLSGRLMWPAGADAGRAHVVLFPSDRTLWSVNGGASDRFRTVLTGTSGRFLFEGLRAGAYYVAAVREGPPGGARTDRLASLASRAVLVSIGERDVKQIDVVVSGSGR